MSQWTVNRDEPEDTPLGKASSYVGAVVGLAVIGAIAGALLPLILAFTSGPKQGDSWSKRRRANERQDRAMEWAAKDDEGSMTSRALIGAGLGAAGAVVLLVTGAQKKQR